MTPRNRLLRGAMLGAAVSALCISPPALRLLLAEFGMWFLPAAQDREFLPYRAILEVLMPVWHWAVAALCVGALIGSCMAALADALRVDLGLIRSSLRWAAAQRSLHVVLTVVLIASALNGLIKAASIHQWVTVVFAVLAVLTELLAPMWLWRAHRVGSQARRVLPSYVWLSAFAMLILGRAAGVSEGQYVNLRVVPAWMLMWTASYLAMGMLMRTQSLPAVWRDRRTWLRWAWIRDDLSMTICVLVLALPLAAAFVWWRLWLIHELPQLTELGAIEGDTVRQVIALGSISMSDMAVPLAALGWWLLLAQGRLAWHHGVANAPNGS